MPGVQYAQDESLTKRQQTMKEIEDTWWRQWIVQALPHLVPFKKWRQEHRSVKKDDIVLILYDKNIGKGEYRLARVLEVYPDAHDVVRTVKVGFRKRNARETLLPYVSKPLEEMKLGVQRLAVLCPVEEQLGQSFEQEVDDSSRTRQDNT